MAFLVGGGGAYALTQMSQPASVATPALVAAGLILLVGVVAVRLWVTAPDQRSGGEGPAPLWVTRTDDLDAELFRLLDPVRLDDRSGSLPAPEQDDRTGAP